ncbi:MAG: 50S ribosomal protein L24 [Opitutales bacterium]|nr:50S ribosomal protein L24 [Opitutales bacterium]
MPKQNIKKGDMVRVICGSQQNKVGKILQVYPAKQRALVEGVGMMKRHTRKSQDNPQGSIEEREAPIHLSNLAKIEAKAANKEEA